MDDQSALDDLHTTTLQEWIHISGHRIMNRIGQDGTEMAQRVLLSKIVATHMINLCDQKTKLIQISV